MRAGDRRALGRTRTCDLLIRSQTRSRTRGDTEGRGETKPRFYQEFSTPEGTRRDRERHGVVVVLWYERAGGGKASMSADSFLPAALCFLLRCYYCRAVRLTTFSLKVCPISSPPLVFWHDAVAPGRWGYVFSTYRKVLSPLPFRRATVLSHCFGRWVRFLLSLPAALICGFKRTSAG